MATNKSKATSGTRESTSAQDAIALLTADHETVRALFEEFEQLTEQEDADERKQELVEQICTELTIHAQVEEEIFYPAVREAIDDDSLMDEADVEHASAKDLIAQLEGMSSGDDHYDAKVVVLGEYINHHVGEEEGEMFEQVREAELDTAALGAAIAERKSELRAEMGIEEDAIEEAEAASEDADDEMVEAPSKRASGNGAKKPRSGARK
jgi:hypothetical protein